MQQNLPKHVAIVPDGNRRWARLRGLPDEDGHREGRTVFHKISKIAFNLGIPYFTFWAMSEDNNTKRSAGEIGSLVSLLKETLESNWTKDLFENQIRFRVLGNWGNLIRDEILAKLIDKFENETHHFDKCHLTILLGYDGTVELPEAILKIITDNWKPFCSHQLNAIKETAEKIMKTLWTGELPPVDLEIRTGETHENWFHNSSGFMMLHTANSEIRLSQTLWPDFSVEEFKKIVAEYGQREHKLGA